MVVIFAVSMDSPLMHHKQHSTDHKKNSSISWMANYTIGSRRDKYTILSNAHLKGKHPAQSSTTLKSYDASNSYHECSNDRYEWSIDACRCPTRKNETRQHQAGDESVRHM